jgi:geranylgeranyl diphosphate synthase type II
LNTAAAGLSLAEFIASQGKHIERALSEWLPAEPGCPARLAQAMHYAVFPGGKRLRPLLTLLAADACGGSVEDAMPAACAVEYVHCYSLVHDDLPAMDDDDLRRGRPSCHKVFGEAIAILAGDALLTLAFDVLARRSRSSGLAVASCAELAAAAGACGMVGGQVDDMTAGEQNRSPNSALEMLESMHARKTGALLRACLRLGGLAAGASDDLLHVFDHYGQAIGLAFQITDDLLDVRGAELAAGKRVGKDTGRGKLTFPGLLGIESSQQRSRSMGREAIAALAPLGGRAELLKELARNIIERDR